MEERLIAEAPPILPAVALPPAESVAVATATEEAPDPVLVTMVSLPPVPDAAPAPRGTAAVRLSFAMPPPLVSPVATAVLAEARVDLPLIQPVPASVASTTEAVIPRLHPFDSAVRGGQKLVAPMPPPLPTAVANTHQPDTRSPEALPVTPGSFRSG